MSDTIKYAEIEGCYIIKFEGDIRVTLCASLDDFIVSVFENSKLKSIFLDLSKAQNIDSTALGMIAKIAAKSRQRLLSAPITLSNNSDINRMLECMGLSQVLKLVSNLEMCDKELIESFKSQAKDMPLGDHSQAHLCDKVLDAHQALVALSDDNKSAFEELILNLKEERAGYTKH